VRSNRKSLCSHTLNVMALQCLIACCFGAGLSQANHGQALNDEWCFGMCPIYGYCDCF